MYVRKKPLLVLLLSLWAVPPYEAFTFSVAAEVTCESYFANRKGGFIG
jgi:hypothetical protein